jgi:hypothetical protein
MGTSPPVTLLCSSRRMVAEPEGPVINKVGLYKILAMDTIYRVHRGSSIHVSLLQNVSLKIHHNVILLGLPGDRF